MRIRICHRCNCRKQLLERRHTKLQTQGTIAIVGIKPIVTWTKHHSRCDQNGLMSGTTDLKENLVLILELNFFIIEPPRQIHRAKHLEHFFARWARTFATLTAAMASSPMWCGHWRWCCGRKWNFRYRL